MKIVYQESEPKTCQAAPPRKHKAAFSRTPSHELLIPQPSAELSVHSALPGHPFQDPELQIMTANVGGVQQNGGGQQAGPCQQGETEHLLLLSWAMLWDPTGRAWSCWERAPREQIHQLLSQQFSVDGHCWA